MKENQIHLNKINEVLLDPLGKTLIDRVEWWKLEELSSCESELFPVSISGAGDPILLIHGFDSCFLEFRRLVPYLENSNKLIIPDLYGFGFCPRPKDSEYGIEMIITHLNQILKKIKTTKKIGLIGASMGGGIAMELARRNVSKIDRLLLLSPAGLTGRPKPVPKPLDEVGVCILRNKFVRKRLCITAFANPKKDVGEKEIQIASIHLNVPGWDRSLAAFARSGGVANCGLPLPKQKTKILWGKKDKILNDKERTSCMNLIKCDHEEIDECGHLPHIDAPKLVADKWNS